MEAVAYAVAVDLGDPTSPWDCVHPRRKREVGRRIALAAAGIERGRRIRGPEFIPEAPALLFGDVATGDKGGRYGRRFDRRGGADSRSRVARVGGHRWVQSTGTARCCAEAPFEFGAGPRRRRLGSTRRPSARCSAYRTRRVTEGCRDARLF